MERPMDTSKHTNTAGTEVFRQHDTSRSIRQFVNVRFKLYNVAFHSQHARERVIIIQCAGRWWGKDACASFTQEKPHTSETLASQSVRPSLCLSFGPCPYFTRWQRTTHWVGDTRTHARTRTDQAHGVVAESPSHSARLYQLICRSNFTAVQLFASSSSSLSLLWSSPPTHYILLTSFYSHGRIVNSQAGLWTPPATTMGGTCN